MNRFASFLYRSSFAVSEMITLDNGTHSGIDNQTATHTGQVCEVTTMIASNELEVMRTLYVLLAEADGFLALEVDEENSFFDAVEEAPVKVKEPKAAVLVLAVDDDDELVESMESAMANEDVDVADEGTVIAEQVLSQIIAELKTDRKEDAAGKALPVTMRTAHVSKRTASEVAHEVFEPSLAAVEDVTTEIRPTIREDVTEEARLVMANDASEADKGAISVNEDVPTNVKQDGDNEFAASELTPAIIVSLAANACGSVSKAVTTQQASSTMGLVHKDDEATVVEDGVHDVEASSEYADNIIVDEVVRDLIVKTARSAEWIPEASEQEKRREDVDTTEVYDVTSAMSQIAASLALGACAFAIVDNQASNDKAVDVDETVTALDDDVLSFASSGVQKRSLTLDTVQAAAIEGNVGDSVVEEAAFTSADVSLEVHEEMDANELTTDKSIELGLEKALQVSAAVDKSRRETESDRLVERKLVSEEVEAVLCQAEGPEATTDTVDIGELLDKETTSGKTKASELVAFEAVAPESFSVDSITSGSTDRDVLVCYKNVADGPPAVADSFASDHNEAIREKVGKILSVQEETFAEPFGDKWLTPSLLCIKTTPSAVMLEKGKDDDAATETNMCIHFADDDGKAPVLEDVTEAATEREISAVILQDPQGQRAAAKENILAVEMKETEDPKGAPQRVRNMTLETDETSDTANVAVAKSEPILSGSVLDPPRFDEGTSSEEDVKKSMTSSESDDVSVEEAEEEKVAQPQELAETLEIETAAVVEEECAAVKSDCVAVEESEAKTAVIVEEAVVEAETASVKDDAQVVDDEVKAEIEIVASSAEIEKDGVKETANETTETAQDAVEEVENEAVPDFETKDEEIVEAEATWEITGEMVKETSAVAFASADDNEDNDDKVAFTESTTPPEVVGEAIDDHFAAAIVVECDGEERLSSNGKFEVDTKPISTVSKLIGRFEEIAKHNATEAASSRPSSCASSRVSSPLSSSRPRGHTDVTSTKDCEASENVEVAAHVGPIEEIVEIEVEADEEIARGEQAAEVAESVAEAPAVKEAVGESVIEEAVTVSETETLMVDEVTEESAEVDTSEELTTVVIVTEEAIVAEVEEVVQKLVEASTKAEAEIENTRAVDLEVTESNTEPEAEDVDLEMEETFENAEEANATDIKVTETTELGSLAIEIAADAEVEATKALASSFDEPEDDVMRNETKAVATDAELVENSMVEVQEEVETADFTTDESANVFVPTNNQYEENLSDCKSLMQETPIDYEESKESPAEDDKFESMEEERVSEVLSEPTTDVAVANEATATATVESTAAKVLDDDVETCPERDSSQFSFQDYLTYEILGVTRVSNVIMYHIYKINRATAERALSIPKRYSDFKLLDEQLRALDVPSAENLPLLPKPSVGTFLRGRRSKKTIEMREKAFGDLLRYVRDHKDLHESAVFQQFIAD